MTINSYTEETTRGADPTQLETWKCSTDKGTPFTVTQFFGDYLVEYPGESKKDAPAWMVALCTDYAERHHDGPCY